jgi:hypothetical protein
MAPRKPWAEQTVEEKLTTLLYRQLALELALQVVLAATGVRLQPGDDEAEEVA